MARLNLQKGEDFLDTDRDVHPGRGFPFAQELLHLLLVFFWVEFFVLFLERPWVGSCIAYTSLVFLFHTVSPFLDDTHCTVKSGLMQVFLRGFLTKWENPLRLWARGETLTNKTGCDTVNPIGELQWRLRGNSGFDPVADATHLIRTMPTEGIGLMQLVAAVCSSCEQTAACFSM